MSAYTPEQAIAQLVAAAGLGTVVVLKGAQESAATDFNLHSVAAVVGWIAGGGIESHKHIRTKPWKNNPDPSVQIDVLSYDFHSGPKFGYLAVMHSPKTGKWIVKSLKKNSQPNPKATLGELLLMKQRTLGK